MARPREFDRDTVLEKAMTAFWDHGFESTSLAVLVEHMGISRASLYDTFGSKDELFVEAMARYNEMMHERFLAPLRAPGDPREILQSFLYGMVDQLCAPEGHTCLVIKAATSPCKDRGQAGEGLVQCMKTVDDAFHALFVRARDAGQIESSRNLRSLSRFFTSVMHGLNVRAGVQADRRILRELIREALSTLD